MKHLKSYKIFESVDDIKSVIEDMLRDSVLDRDIHLKIHVRNYTTIGDNKKFEVIKIQIGNEFDDLIINVDDLKQDILTITKYLEEEGYIYDTFSYYDTDDYETIGNAGDIMKSYELESNYLGVFYKKEIIDESIKVPIEIGDTVLGGRFKNKKTLVKKIGKNKKGDITINDKPLLKYRIVKESLQDVDYYFKHLEDDGFYIKYEESPGYLLGEVIHNGLIRICKPSGLNDRGYNFPLHVFRWDEIVSEVARYVSEIEDINKSISYMYVIKPEHGQFLRKTLVKEMVLDETFDAGEITSFVIGFK